MRTYYGMSTSSFLTSRKIFQRASLTVLFSLCILFILGCGDTKPDPDAGKGTGAPTTPEEEKKSTIDEKTLKALMKYGLHRAAAEGDLEAVQAFIRAGAPLEEYDAFQGLTPLLFAARQGHPEVVRALLSAGVNPDKAIEVTDSTALHLAAYNGHVEAAKVLLEGKANPNLKNWNGETPLHKAAEKGHAEVVTILLAAPNIDLTIRNEDGKTARDVAKDDSIKALFPAY